MSRALELAVRGRGFVAPNPMVGCVIVHDNGSQQRIIGEGWHQQYGQAHAERNAILSVKSIDNQLFADCTAYVTLEPCSHTGKQPPCADLLIEQGIGRVVVCNHDPNPLVAGRGLQKLRQAGITVETGILEAQGRWLNRRFFTFIEQQRPYVILKWAETADRFIGGAKKQPVAISGPIAQRLNHRWRTEEDAILVGTTTAHSDNPRLNARLWPGRNPTRIVLDQHQALPDSLNLFDGSQPTIRYTDQILAPFDLPQLLTDLHSRGIQSLIVEGGAATLQGFIDADLWDEARIFRSPRRIGNGTKSPIINGEILKKQTFGSDELRTVRRIDNRQN
jgi:diaminohydroxyphosphoribosylaminopyrimidine deaminase / 5-amino-6-(5-phosphoribosylamino)uracil reductase